MSDCNTSPKALAFLRNLKSNKVKNSGQEKCTCFLEKSLNGLSWDLSTIYRRHFEITDANFQLTEKIESRKVLGSTGEICPPVWRKFHGLLKIDFYLVEIKQNQVIWRKITYDEIILESF